MSGLIESAGRGPRRAELRFAVLTRAGLGAECVSARQHTVFEEN